MPAHPGQSHPLLLDGRHQTVHYLAGGDHDDAPAETLDALDLLARVLAHFPDPRRHLARCYGAYSNVMRGKQKASSAGSTRSTLCSACAAAR